MSAAFYNPPLMSSGYFNAIRLLLRAHRRSSLLSHAHIVGRFLTCPFLRVIDLLPDRCRLLDIGAGHGTFARLALAAGAAEAVALEPDLQKSLQSAGGDGLRLVTGFAGAVRGTFDVVSMIDVLYRIPHGEWDDLFALIYSHVSPGGIFLLKEIDPEAPLKAAWNKAQERLADRLLHLTTIGNHHDYESRAALQARLERAGFTSFEVHELGAGYPHAHIAYLARRS